MQIFLSHSSKNSKEAEKICRLIEEKGNKCFFAPRDIRSGYEYAEEIINGIDSSEAVLLLLSKASNDSPHVLREIERAVSKNIPIIVYKLDEVKPNKSMEYFLMAHQWVNEKPDSDYKKIITAIDQFSADKKSEIKETEKLAVKPVKSRKPVITGTVTAAAVIGVFCAFFLPKLLNNQPPNAENGDTFSQSEIINPPDHAQETETQINDSFGSSQQTESTPETPSNSSQYAELGDTVVLGKYNGEPISWRVIDLYENGSKALVISDKILTMKCYDAAEGGKYNSYDGKDYWAAAVSGLSEEIQIKVRGNNVWELSNIRTWLNSDKENVDYADQAPEKKAMSDLKNAYDTESGFLKSFSEEEMALILISQVSTDGKVTEDKIFLLSSDELLLLEKADVSIHTAPTEIAKERDETKLYSSYFEDIGIYDFRWWLRDADPSSSCEAKMVDSSYGDETVIKQAVGIEGYGIRPAMKIDLAKATIEKADKEKDKQ